MNQTVQRLLRSAARAATLILASLALWGGLTTVMAQEAEAEPDFVPVLTPEAEQIFAEMPDTSVQIPEVYELLNVAIAMANVEDFLPEEITGDDFMIDMSMYIN